MLRGAFRAARPFAARATAAATAAAGAAFAAQNYYAESKSDKTLGSLKMVEDKPHPLDLEIQQRFLALEQGEKVQAEYVWVGVRSLTLDLATAAGDLARAVPRASG